MVCKPMHVSEWSKMLNLVPGPKPSGNSIFTRPQGNHSSQARIRALLIISLIKYDLTIYNGGQLTSQAVLVA